MSFKALVAACALALPIAAQAQDVNEQMIEAARQMRVLANQSEGILPADQIAELRRSADEMEASARAEMAAAAAAPPVAADSQAPSVPAGAKTNWLADRASCQGFTVENYRTFTYDADMQLSTMCAAAYNYYAAYLRALGQGYSVDDADPTYQAFDKSATVADSFYESTRD